MGKKYYRRLYWEVGYIIQYGIIIKCFDEDVMIQASKDVLYNCKDGYLYIEVSGRSRKLYETDNKPIPSILKTIQAYCTHHDENGKSSLVSDKDNGIECSMCGAKFRSMSNLK